MHYLVIFVLLVEIAGYCHLMYRAFRIPIAVTPAVYVSAVIVLLYASDFIGLLWYIRIVIHVVGLAAALHLFGSADFRTLIGGLLQGRYFDHDTKLRIQYRPVFVSVLFAAFVFLAVYMNHNLIFWKWDEFSHWGSVIRMVATANTFHLTPNPLYFPDYPLGTALFSYHLLGLSGYSEGMAIVSYDIILLAFLLPIVANAFAANLLFGLVTTFLCYILMILLGHGWDGVTIDHVLSTIFAGAVAAYFCMPLTWKTAFALPLSLAALALSKQSGTFFALLAASICAIDLIIARLSSPPSDQIKGHRRFGYLHVMWIIALIASPLLASASWKAHIEANGYAPTWRNANYVLPGLKRCCETELETKVANTYFARYFGVAKGEPIKGSILDIAKYNLEKVEPKAELPTAESPPLSMFGFLILCWLILTLFLGKGVARWRGVATIAILSIGMALYSVTMMLMYVYMFHPYEAAYVASFERYHYTYILGAFLIALFSIGTIVSATHIIGRWFVSILVAAWAYGFTGAVQFNQDRSERFVKNTAMHVRIRAIAEQVRRAIPRGKSIYIGWLDSNGFEHLMMYYEMLPTISSKHCWSVVARQPAPHFETCIMSEAELIAFLRQYDYAIVGDGLSRMKQDYPSIWASALPEDTKLFRLDKNEASVKAIPLPN